MSDPENQTIIELASSLSKRELELALLFLWGAVVAGRSGEQIEALLEGLRKVIKQQ